MPSKDEAAEALIEWHFQVEPALVLVYRVLVDNEDDPTEPIKLIEVNTATVATGSLEAYRFAPTRDLPYPTLIAEVTPDELDALQRSDGLPRGWSLDRARRYSRPAA